MVARLEVDVHGCTDIGKVRKGNEDQYLIVELHKAAKIKRTSLPQHFQNRLVSKPRGLLLMVADGVGGDSGGEEASTVALETILDIPIVLGQSLVRSSFKRTYHSLWNQE